MKIDEYITTHALQRVNAVPPSLAHEFDLADDVDSDAQGTRYLGVCKARNFFAAWKPQAITTGNLDQSYATLRAF